MRLILAVGSVVLAALVLAAILDPDDSRLPTVLYYGGWAAALALLVSPFAYIEDVKADLRAITRRKRHRR